METWFIQGFTKDLEMFYIDKGINKINRYTFKSPFDFSVIKEKIEEDEETMKVVFDGTPQIETVKLKGRSSILKRIETYYN